METSTPNAVKVPGEPVTRSARAKIRRRDVESAEKALIRIQCTPHEMNQGELFNSHLEDAVRALRVDGVVVLENVIAQSHLKLLQKRMAEDLRRILCRPDVPFNFSTGNIQQGAPRVSPFLFKDILENNLVAAVTEG